MPNEISIVQSNETSIVAFGRILRFDSLNTVDHIDESTVVIKPRFNTTGLRELKVF